MKYVLHISFKRLLTIYIQIRVAGFLKFEVYNINENIQRAYRQISDNCV